MDFSGMSESKIVQDFIKAIREKDLDTGACYLLPYVSKVVTLYSNDYIILQHIGDDGISTIVDTNIRYDEYAAKYSDKDKFEMHNYISYINQRDFLLPGMPIILEFI